MKYIKLSTLQYPLHEGDIRLDHPEIGEELTGESFPCPDTYAPVEVDPVPSFDIKTHRVVPIAPTRVGDKWIQQWSLEELSAEIKAQIAETDRKAEEEEQKKWGHLQHLL